MGAKELEEIRRLEDKIDEQMLDIREELKNMWKEIGQRVTWGWLWTILVFVGGVVGTMFGLLYNNIQDVSKKIDAQNEKVSSIREDVSSVNTIIKQLDFQVKR